MRTKILSFIWMLLMAVSSQEAICNSIEQIQESYYDQALVELFQKNKIQLIVIRHGEGIHNLTETMTSSRSPGVYLTEKGISQVKAAAKELSKYSIQKMYISPVFRTLQTAQILGEELKLSYLQMVVEDRLREQSFGTFENKTYDEYLACFSSKEQIFINAVPQGESGIELFNRTQAFLWEIASCHFDTTILLVTHAFNCCQINKCLTGSFQDTPTQAQPKIYNF